MTTFLDKRRNELFVGHEYGCWSLLMCFTDHLVSIISQTFTPASEIAGQEFNP